MAFVHYLLSRAKLALMIRLLKILLLWTLVVALPSQGVAAVVHTSCGAQSFAVAHAHGEGQSVVPTAVMQHHHGGMGLSDRQAKPALHHPDGHSPHHKAVSCTTCGSCCVGACAMPELFAFPVAGTTAPTLVIAPAALVTGFIPDGLERPPRHFSI